MNQRFGDEPQAIPGGRVVAKAIIKTYTAGTHKADVQIVGSHPTVLTAVRVATDIPAADVIAGRQCTVLFLDPANQDDAVVISIQGALPSTPSGATVAASATVVSETAFGQAAAAGGASPYSRGDHTHGSPTDPITAHVGAADPHSPYALTPVHFDAVVDGVGTKTGHYAQITAAIAAAKVNILVLPKPSGGRYDAFTAATGDAVKSIQGTGPGVLCAAITTDKDDLLLAHLESNARVTVTALRNHLERIVCKAAADTGFTLGAATDNLPDGLLMVDCAVLQTTGIAIDIPNPAATALYTIDIRNFQAASCTGANVIRAAGDASLLRIDGLRFGAGVAPTQHVLSIAIPLFTLANAALNCTIAATYRLLNIVGSSVVACTNLLEVPEGTVPPIYLDIAGIVGGFYIFQTIDNLTVGSGTQTPFEIPLTVGTGPILIIGATTNNAALVTGTGKWNGLSNVANTSALPDRWAFQDLQPNADNQRQVGTSTVAWAQVWAYIHGIQNYAEFKSVSAPGSPATTKSRLYQRTIDASNEGLFHKIKEAGAIAEVAITKHAARHDASGADGMAIDAAAATGSLRTLGAGAAQAAAGDHSHAGGVNVKSGVISAVADAGTGTVTFTTPFAATPRVQLTLFHATNAAVDIPIVTAVSATAFSYLLHKGHTGAGHTWDIHWLATDAGNP